MDAPTFDDFLKAESCLAFLSHNLEIDCELNGSAWDCLTFTRYVQKRMHLNTARLSLIKESERLLRLTTKTES